MKRIWVVSVVSVLLLGLALTSSAKPRIYKWVKDRQVSSMDVLNKSEYTRVLAINEMSALDWVKTVMSEDLFMSQAAYHKTRHQQDAETNPDSVLPEEIVRQVRVELADEDYRFLLEVTLRSYGDNRTRVIVQAWPVYRIRDAEAEEARDDTTGENSVEVKIKGDRNSAVGLGPIFVMPILGMPSDYNIAPLPDASDRAGKLVRSFLYFMDKRISANKPKSSVRDEDKSARNQDEAPAASEAPAAGKNDSGVEVDIKVKQKK